jgi:biotin carboxyl carrier protein
LGGQSWRITARDLDEEISALEVREDLVVYRSAGATISVTVSPIPDGYSLVYQGRAHRLHRPKPSDSGGSGASAATGQGNLTAPMPGTIVRIAVSEGQTVHAGEPLVVMEAMKMEHIVEATSAGTIGSILVQPGEMVAAGAVLVQMEA